MLNWLGVTNKENWEIIKQNNIWGASSSLKTTMEKINVGEKLVIYIKRDISAFGGIFEIISNPYSDTNIKWKTGSYPILIDLKPQAIAKKFIPIKELVPKLNFIKNKQKYTPYFWGKGMRKMIPDEDIEFLMKILK